MKCVAGQPTIAVFSTMFRHISQLPTVRGSLALGLLRGWPNVISDVERLDTASRKSRRACRGPQEVCVTNRRSGMRWGVRLALALALGTVAVSPAAAQSTIFNIPTTDTVAPQHGYFEFDYLNQAPAPELGQFQTFAPRFVAGVGPQAEVGVNLFTTHISDGGGNVALLSPNAKYKFFADDAKGLAAAAGIIGYFAVNNRDANDSFGQIYAEVSKKIKSGARFTGGVYGALSCAACDGAANKAGALLGYEQPLGGSKVSFVADWFSGKNFWGYFTPGISVSLPRNGLLNIGYSIGNNAYNNDPGNDTHNKALFVYYGITFP